jgi:hypothetical protein
MRTDGHEVNSRFSQFYERAYNGIQEMELKIGFVCIFRQKIGRGPSNLGALMSTDSDYWFKKCFSTGDIDLDVEIIVFIPNI